MADVEVKADWDITEEEKEKYIEAVSKRIKSRGGHPADLLRIELKTIPDNQENVDVHYDMRTPKFERIRRITGYLVGSVDRWNDAKQAELKDRVKHV